MGKRTSTLKGTRNQLVIPLSTLRRICIFADAIVVGSWWCNRLALLSNAPNFTDSTTFFSHLLLASFVNDDGPRYYALTLGLTKYCLQSTQDYISIPSSKPSTDINCYNISQPPPLFWSLCVIVPLVVSSLSDSFSLFLVLRIIALVWYMIVRNRTFAETISQTCR